MKTEEKEFLEDISEEMLRDMMILDTLKKESDVNYMKIMSGIRRRRNFRVLFTVAGSCAAAVVLLLMLTTPQIRKEDCILDMVELPTLITDSGEKISLDSGNSYTLDLHESQSTAAEETVMKIPAPSGNLTDAKAGEVTGTLNKASDIRHSTVAIPQGYTYNILFDDGTEAYLNSGSYIEFPKSFEGRKDRKVTLRGEGYFKVAASDRPFIVSAGDLEVKVYGTEFNINTNKEGRIETILVSGSVGVRENGSEDEVIMRPNEMLTYDTKSHKLSVETVEPYEYLSWMRGDFTFNDRPLSELIEEIESFYNIEIAGGRDLDDMQVTISLSRKLGHKQIIEILEYALGIDFQQTGNRTYNCKTN